MSKTGLSILIPVYNCDVSNLVNTLHKQATSLNIPFEIRCYDDCSDLEFKKFNTNLSYIDSVVYNELPKNIGRSAIRNKLAKESNYQFLLFLDSDSTIILYEFVRNYWSNKSLDKIITGGTVYHNEYSPEYALRFYYGKKREEKSLEDRTKNPYQNISFNNLFIPKDIFTKILLDETIRTYGHEDSKFASIISKQNVTVQPINNPVQHSGLESNEQFLNKSKTAVENFYKITQEGHCHETKLYKAFHFLKKWKLNTPALVLFNIIKSSMDRNLNSAQPSLLCFDLFKLHQLLLIDRENKTHN